MFENVPELIGSLPLVGLALDVGQRLLGLAGGRNSASAQPMGHSNSPGNYEWGPFTQRYRTSGHEANLLMG